MGVRARRRRPGGASVATATHASTGSPRPFTCWAPSDSYVMMSAVVACVDGPTTTWPGAASASSRLAVFTASPMAVISPPSAPTITSPVFTPTRIWTSTPMRSASVASVRCIWSPQRTARSASSSCATGAPKMATISSPTILSTRPPYAVTSDASAAKHESTSRFTCSGSAASAIPVKPTRSPNTRVATRRSSGRVTSAWPQVAQKRASGERSPRTQGSSRGQTTGHATPARLSSRAGCRAPSGRLETRAAVIDNGPVATRLTDAEVEEALRSLPGWARDGDTIVKLYEAESFPANIEFVRRIADLAEGMNHHPDLDIRYTKLRVALSTHDAGGLTRLDVDLAGQIDDAEG